jgi:hypothetical protein
LLVYTTNLEDTSATVTEFKRYEFVCDMNITVLCFDCEMGDGSMACTPGALGI